MEKNGIGKSACKKLILNLMPLVVMKEAVQMVEEYKAEVIEEENTRTKNKNEIRISAYDELLSHLTPLVGKKESTEMIFKYKQEVIREFK